MYTFLLKCEVKSQNDSEKKLNLSVFQILLAFFFSLFLIFNTENSFSQLNSNLKTQSVQVSYQSIVLDSLSIIPNSVFIYSENSKIPSTFYQINELYSTLIFDTSFVNQHFNSQLTVYYRVFSTNFSLPKSNKTLHLINPELSDFTQKYTLNSNKNDFFNDNQLTKEGNISRGISFGNNQDAIVNSNFNMSLNGKLNEKISIKASVSENNVPFQAEGNTQQLQEFDKMFIQFYSKESSLIVGDFELLKPKSYFLNLNKKVKGTQFSHTQSNSKVKVNTTSAASVAKGAYNRMKLQGQENNQGPYRLFGAYNESFIIVLSGSEQVYINGKLLARGEENQYTIDYNKAEIIFNNNTPINKDSRIVVEFEYSERNYARFNLFSANEMITKKGKFGLNFYSETDSKTQNLNQELSDEEKILLSQIGNNLNQGFVPNVENVEFDPELILYRKMDTLVESVVYQDVFVYSTNSESAIYKLGFAFVGQNKGNYVKVNSTANGKVFQWLGPKNGILQGDYEPIKQLITPKKKQMLSFWADRDLSQKINSNFEIAFTNNDLNTYSTLQDDENQSYAVNLQLSFPSESFLSRKYKQDSLILADSLKREFYQIEPIKFFTSVQYQFVHKYFGEIERFREAEFNREWNLPDTTFGNQTLLTWKARYQFTDSSFVNYNLNLFKFGDSFQAIKNNFESTFFSQKTKYALNTSLLNNEGEKHRSNYFKYLIQIERIINSLDLGFQNRVEYNLWKSSESENFLVNSFYFNEINIFLQKKNKLYNSWKLNYALRNDFLPKENKLIKNSLAHDLNLDLKLLKRKNNQLKFNYNYRKLVILDSLISELEPLNSSNFQLEHAFKLWKNAFTSNMMYQTNSGLELKREYAYLEVDKGQGNYIWNDYNANGIRELDEFELSNFSYDGEYIKILQPSTDYERIFGNKFSFSANLNPQRIWKKATGFKKVLSRFSNQFAYTANQKTQNLDFMPYVYSKQNLSEFRNLNLNSRNVFSFNKTARVFGADYSYLNSKDLILNANGLDFSSSQSNELKLRLLLYNSLKLENKLSSGIKTFDSEFMPVRNYEIQNITNSLSLIVQNSRKLKLNLEYVFAEKQNNLGEEQSVQHKIGAKFTYSEVNKSNLNIGIDYVKINFSSQMNNSIAYNMLEGLQTGNNLIWNVVYLRSISKLLQLNLSYSGRAANQKKAIHNASVQLQASF